MKILPAILAAFLLTLSARAEVIIYSQTSHDTFTGLGRVAVTNTTGFVVFDTDGHIFSLEANRAARSFHVFDSSVSLAVHYVRASSKKQLMVISSTANSETLADAGANVGKGTSKSVNIGTKSLNLAKVISVSGSAVGGNEDDGWLMQTRGRLVFNSSKTIAFNRSGLTTEQAVANLRASLLENGYTETP